LYASAHLPMNRPILLAGATAIVALAAVFMSKTYYPSHSPRVRAETHEIESDPPPPPEVKEARFGGERGQTQRKALSPLAPTVTVPTWQELGPLNMTDPGQTTAYEPSQGRMNSVAVDPKNAQHLYAGGASGGVWVTTDGGTTWSPRAQTLPVITISSLVVDPIDGNIVYAATGDADGRDTPSIGVYKSIDGGATWAVTGLTYQLTDFRYIPKLTIDPTNGSNVYAATTAGVYYTRNGGTNWTKVLPDGNNFTVYRDIKLRPGSPATVYTVTDAGVCFRSVNSGVTWQAATAGLPDPATTGRAVLGVTAADPNIVFLLAASSTDLGIYKSVDGGSTFARLPSDSLKQFAANQATFYDLVLAVSPINSNELMGGVVSVIRSTDGGATWFYTSSGPNGNANPIVHVDQHCVEYINNAIYNCSDGGLHRSPDGGVTWANLSPTLGVGQIYQFAGSKQNPSLIYVGEQDNGFNRYNGTKWEHINFGDFGRIAVDPTNDQVVYASANYALFKYTDFSANPTQLQVTAEGKRFEGAPIVINPTNTQVVYAGYQNVHRSVNGGTTWNKLSNFTDQQNVNAIALAPSDPKTIYVARSLAFSSTGSFYRSTDEGASFADVSAGLPNTVTGIAVDPKNAMRLWISLQGGNTNAVYFSQDGGANWANFSGTTLPNSSTRAIVYENGTQDALYVGTVAGVYYRNATMNDWQAYNNNLPNAIVDSLEIDYSTKQIRAGTFGRGLWESLLVGVTPGAVANVSTRLPVGTGDNVLIEGFIVQGPAGSIKKILVRAIGPSLTPFGITDALANPTLEIHDSTNATIATNDNWKTTQVGGIITGDQFAEINASQLAPTNDLESAIIANLAPGSYTAVVRGSGNTVGTGVVDAFDLSAASPAKLANVATRGLIQPGDKLMIAGFIVQNGPVRAVVRAIGPSLLAFGVNNALADTTLQVRDQNGALVVENDNWKTRPDGSSQQAEIEATSLQPTNDLEAAVLTTLQPGQYTAQVRGKPESTGTGVVQVYFLQ
jgi:photosystem II stability/assembly factor-like uncharacterized protein